MVKQRYHVAVLGATGMLGHVVAQRFRVAGHIVYTSYRDPHLIEHDARSGAFVFDVARDPLEMIPKCDYIINCTGVIPQRSTDIAEMWRVNAVFPHRLAHARHSASRVIHVTTDCVFSGAKGLYDELAVHDATSMYGLSKSAGEPQDAMCIRTSIVGPELFGRQSNLLEWFLGTSGVVDGFVDHAWNGVTTRTLAHMIIRIVEENLYVADVRHVYSPDDVSKYELLKCIAAAYGHVVEVREHESGAPIDRRLRSIHDLNEKIMAHPLREQLRVLALSGKAK